MNLALTCMMLVLLGGSVWCSMQGTRSSTPRAIENSARLLGLEFEERELELMSPGVLRHRGLMKALRERSLSNEDAPAFHFDPRVPGRSPHARKAGSKAWSLPEFPELERPADDRELCYLSVPELAALVHSRKISCLELTEAYLARLESIDEELACVVTLLPERARTRARALDAELERGLWRGPLHGLPWGAKDLFAVRGAPTTWGAKPFEDQTIDQDAAMVERLDEAGAVLIAKLTLGSLAMGDVWFGGTTKSPWNVEVGSSGSSAGSAAAVVAGGVAFALGTETYGSIVSPADRCGASALRPSFGRVSRHGAMALSWTMDKVGPMCRSVRDSAIVFDAIRGADPRDPGTRDAPFTHWAELDPASLRVGFVEAEFEKAERDAHVLDELRELGFELLPVTLPEAPQDVLPVVLFSEAAAAFDELTRSGQDDELVQQTSDAWPNLFRTARLLPAVEYVNANRVRTKLCRELNAALAEVDVLVHPSFGGPELALTNLTGHPTVVLPAGFDEHGEPWSICFTGRLDGEAELLEVARRWQEAGEFHLRRPPF